MISTLRRLTRFAPQARMQGLLLGCSAKPHAGTTGLVPGHWFSTKLQAAASSLHATAKEHLEAAPQAVAAEPRDFDPLYVGEMDLGNVITAMEPVDAGLTVSDIMSKLAYLSPKNLYLEFDQFTRDSILYLADEMGWGMGLSIAAISFGIKFFFLPIMMATQVNVLKTKLLEPETKQFQIQQQWFQKQGDLIGLRNAQKQFSKFKKQMGIKNWVTVLGLVQAPVLITWFISLRYMTSQA